MDPATRPGREGGQIPAGYITYPLRLSTPTVDLAEDAVMSILDRSCADVIREHTQYSYTHIRTIWGVHFQKFRLPIGLHKTSQL